MTFEIIWPVCFPLKRRFIQIIHNFQVSHVQHGIHLPLLQFLLVIHLIFNFREPSEKLPKRKHTFKPWLVLSDNFHLFLLRRGGGRGTTGRNIFSNSIFLSWALWWSSISGWGGKFSGEKNIQNRREGGALQDRKREGSSPNWGLSHFFLSKISCVTVRCFGFIMNVRKADGFRGSCAWR